MNVAINLAVDLIYSICDPPKILDPIDEVIGLVLKDLPKLVMKLVMVNFWHAANEIIYATLRGNGFGESLFTVGQY